MYGGKNKYSTLHSVLSCCIIINTMFSWNVFPQSFLSVNPPTRNRKHAGVCGKWCAVHWHLHSIDWSLGVSWRSHKHTHTELSMTDSKDVCEVEGLCVFVPYRIRISVEKWKISHTKSNIYICLDLCLQTSECAYFEMFVCFVVAWCISCLTCNASFSCFYLEEWDGVLTVVPAVWGLERLLSQQHWFGCPPDDYNERHKDTENTGTGVLTIITEQVHNS